MKLGPYEIGGELGRGGLGIVYRAVGPAGEVAVKVLRRLEGETRARFERERRLLASLGEAKGFVPLLDGGEEGGVPYLVMPLLTGGSLRDRLKRGPQTVEATVALGRSLARALGEAHALGIVHRDLKPENVLFAADGRPLVADLGLAKHFDGEAPGASQSAALSQSGALAGTVGYASKEQMTDARSAGPPADVFALGAILAECLTGRPPFSGGSVLEVLTKVTRGDREKVARARPDAPSWLVSVVERALATEPGDRPADGFALERALAPPLLRVRSGAVAGAVAAMALVGAGAAWVALREDRPPGPRPPVSPAPVSSRTPVAPLPTPRATPSRDPSSVARLRAERRRALFADFSRLPLPAARLERVDAALALDPDDPDLHADRAWTLIQRFEEATSCGESASEHETGARESLDRARALAATPECRAHEAYVRARLAGACSRDAEKSRELARARDEGAGEFADLARTLVDGATLTQRSALLRAVLARTPGSVEGWWLLAASEEGEGNSRGAEEAASRALALVELGDARLARSRARFEQGDVPGAEADARRAVELAPRDRKALGALGVLLLRTDRVAEVRAVAARLQTVGGIAEATLFQACALARTGERDGAALAALDAQIPILGGGFLEEALDARARIRERTGDLGGACADLGRAITSRHQEASDFVAKAIRHVGLLLVVRGDASAADAGLASLGGPVPRELACERLHVALLLGDLVLASAREAQAAALARVPDARLAQLRGDLVELQGTFAADLAGVERAFPGRRDAEARSARADVLGRFGLGAAALAELGPIERERDPDARALVLRARTRVPGRSLVDALADSEAAVALAPSWPRALAERAWFRALAGRAGAREDADRASALDPKDPLVGATRARTLLQLGERAAGRAQAEITWGAAPSSREAHEARAWILQDLGDRAGAAASLRVLLASDTRDVRRRLRERRIAHLERPDPGAR